MTSIRPIAIGRESVISGILGPRTGAAFFAPACVSGVKVRPQTGQRVAFSLKRVPHVGQFLMFLVSSGLMLFFREKVTGVLSRLGNYNTINFLARVRASGVQSMFMLSSTHARQSQPVYPHPILPAPLRVLRFQYLCWLIGFDSSVCRCSLH